MPLDNASSAARLAALQLAADPNYRILSRIQHTHVFDVAEPGQPLLRGAVVDTESTGRDPNRASLCEVAIVPFTYTADGTVIEVLEDEVYTGLQDPRIPIPPEVTALTGLQQSDVEGQTLDLRRIEEVIAPCNMLIAHYAGYDRRLLERLLPIFREKVWACSVDLVPWFDEGVHSAKLDYILTQYGYFYDAHRAESDCRALLHLLAQPLLSSGRMPLAVMREALHVPTYAIWLRSSPYGAKSDLYDAGYRWVDTRQAPMKGYRRLVPATEVDPAVNSVVELLARHRHQEKPVVLPVPAIDRYTDRV